LAPRGSRKALQGFFATRTTRCRASRRANAHVPDRALLAAADQVAKRIDAALAGEAGANVIELDPQRARD
jgi:hypothetical protein